MKSFENQLGPNLRTLRGSRTQSEFSRSLGIPQQTYANWETGTRQPKLDDLCKLSLQFEVSTDWLLGLASTPKCIEPNEASHRAQEAERKLGAVQEALSLILKGTQKLQEAVR